MQSSLTGKWALVTGASSGLGVDFARQLAERGANLILVARRENLLRDLQKQLSAQHPAIQIEVLPQDLADPQGPAQLHEKTTRLGLPVEILVNNAGFGLWGDFVEIPWEKERQMLELDIFTLVHLTKLYARDMVARKSGHILQVASIGAYQPCPTYATYGAAKSFVLQFSDAIGYELRKTGVKICTLSPGPTATEFFQVSGQKMTAYQRRTMMDSKTVVRMGLDAMLSGKPRKVPGFMNALGAWLVRFIPRHLATAIANATMQPPPS